MSILLRTGYGREHESQLGQAHQPFAVTDTLAEAATLILSQAE